VQALLAGVVGGADIDIDQLGGGDDGLALDLDTVAPFSSLSVFTGTASSARKGVALTPRHSAPNRM
jgi:hypothetical protein